MSEPVWMVLSASARWIGGPWDGQSVASDEMERETRGGRYVSPHNRRLILRLRSFPSGHYIAEPGSSDLRWVQDDHEPDEGATEFFVVLRRVFNSVRAELDKAQEALRIAEDLTKDLDVGLTIGIRDYGKGHMERLLREWEQS